MSSAYTAIVADDEPLLAQSLVSELGRTWPELIVTATPSNGLEAIEAIKKHSPDIAFLDIRMPGASGLEVAESIAEDWPDDVNHRPENQGKAVTPAHPPLVVFVTAFDDYAVQAFDSAAVDYLLKPVKSQRLATTIDRLKQHLNEPQRQSIDSLSEQIRQIVNQQVSPADGQVGSSWLRVIRASVGDVVRMIPVDDVIFFESSDKYVSVHTQDSEAIIREPLRNLLSQLDPDQFAQIHRSTIVNLRMVDAAARDDTGKITLRLKNHSAQPVVSRLYRHLFQAM
ncbi:MAG: LytR/AlgR family response regulator transcription factor [Granulosicoccus sp.]